MLSPIQELVARFLYPDLATEFLQSSRGSFRAYA